MTENSIAEEQLFSSRELSRLEEHGLGGEMLEAVNVYLEGKGVRITTGTIVDATIIHAPSSTKNLEQKRDPEMHQTKKGNQ